MSVVQPRYRRSAPKGEALKLRRAWPVAMVIAAVGLGLFTLLLAEDLWFSEVGYLPVFWVRLLAQSSLGLLPLLASFWFVQTNLGQANRQAWPAKRSPAPATLSNRLTPPSTDLDPKRGMSCELDYPGQLRLGWLLLVSIGLSSLVAVLLLYHGQIAVSHWQSALSLNSSLSPIPVKFHIQALWQVGQQLQRSPWPLGLLPPLVISILIYPRVLLRAAALATSLVFGIVMAEHWTTVLLASSPTPFELADPLFGRDISFYVMLLPVSELLSFWLVGLCLLVWVSVMLLYLLSGSSISQGLFPGFATPQIRHIYRLGSLTMGAIALSYWVDRYELLYSATGVIYGASYTNVAVELPLYTGLSLGALAIALLLWVRSFALPRLPLRPGDRPEPVVLQKRPAWPMVTIVVAYFGIAALGGVLLPPLVQRLVVQPNELDREGPFIEHTIDLTRQAFGLNDIDVEVFNPQNSLTYQQLLENQLTVNNIRLWDTRPLLETNRQLQRIRLYYEFADADVDRYTLTGPNGSEERQVLIAARELDYRSVPDEAKTWVNQHLIYTHGYGFTMSPVNTAGESGLPQYFIRGIEHIPSSDTVRQSIPVSQPRIYYGELTNNYALTQTNVQELDYPSGSDNVYNTYDGGGGISIGPFWRRLTYAVRLRDWRLLLTEEVTPDTKLLFRRTITDRVQAIAPFLRYDSDPYLVVADPDGPLQPGAALPQSSDPSYLYWVIDAYTVSDRFPYAAPLNNDFNYIRNSVKAVVDAYHGTVAFYIADPDDPIIQTWSRIFPGMFRSLDDMPEALRRHIRYPQDYYRVQAQQLMTYHMTDPRVFYNREDEWRAPSEIYANEQQRLEPYYLLMELPNADQGDFLLFRPYTPAQRRNLIAWLAAQSDGDRYGRQVLYTFPKQELVFGPEQVEARINQDPIISQQISLWNRQGSRAIQGNLLVIPIEQSLLYVEPLYLEAEQNRLPTLVRVIAVYQNRIAMAPTLDAALRAVFDGPAPDDEDTIVRSVDDAPPDADSLPVTPNDLTEETGSDATAPSEDAE